MKISLAIGSKVWGPLAKFDGSWLDRRESKQHHEEPVLEVLIIVPILKSFDFFLSSTSLLEIINQPHEGLLVLQST